MSLNFCPSVVMTGIAQPNNTIKKIESYIPSTTQPLIHTTPPLPSWSAFLSGLFRGIDPNDRLNPDPVTSSSLEERRIRLPNCVRSNMGRIREEYLEGLGSQFGPGGGGGGGGDKPCSTDLGCSDPALTFSTSYRSITPIWLTSVF